MLIDFSANKGTTGVTMSAGTANTETKIVSFQIQPGMKLILQNAALEIKDDGATETADSSYVKVQLRAPNNKKLEILEETLYGQTKFNQDGRLKNRVSFGYKISPFNLLEVLITGSQALATATTRFSLLAQAEV